MEFNGKQIERDAQGYLKNHTDWCEELVPLLAKEENIELTEAHWEVVRFVRNFYDEFKTSPAVRMLVKAMEKSMALKKVTANTYFNYLN